MQATERDLKALKQHIRRVEAGGAPYMALRRRYNAKLQAHRNSRARLQDDIRRRIAIANTADYDDDEMLESELQSVRTRRAKMGEQYSLLGGGGFFGSTPSFPAPLVDKVIRSSQQSPHTYTGKNKALYCLVTGINEICERENNCTGGYSVCYQKRHSGTANRCVQMSRYDNTCTTGRAIGTLTSRAIGTRSCIDEIERFIKALWKKLKKLPGSDGAFTEVVDAINKINDEKDKEQYKPTFNVEVEYGNATTTKYAWFPTDKDDLSKPWVQTIKSGDDTMQNVYTPSRCVYEYMAKVIIKMEKNNEVYAEVYAKKKNKPYAKMADEGLETKIQQEVAAYATGDAVTTRPTELKQVVLTLTELYSKIYASTTIETPDPGGTVHTHTTTHATRNLKTKPIKYE